MYGNNKFYRSYDVKPHESILFLLKRQAIPRVILVF